MAAVSELALTNPRAKKMAAISELRFESARRGQAADRKRLRRQFSCIREWEEPCPEPAPPYSCGVRPDCTPHLRHRRQVQSELLPLTAAPVDPCSMNQRADANLQKHSSHCPLLSHTRILEHEDGLPPHEEYLACCHPCAEVSADLRERWLNCDSWRAKFSPNHRAFCSLEDDVSPPEAGLLGKPTSVQTPERTSTREAPILPDDTIEAELAEVDVTDDLADSTGDQYKRSCGRSFGKSEMIVRPSKQISMKKGNRTKKDFLPV
jgi:hypothetical protein